MHEGGGTDIVIKKNDVVQFNEKHKWCGCLGIVREAKKCGDDIRYMVGIPIPQEGTAYIFAMESNREIERIGIAALIQADEEDDE